MITDKEDNEFVCVCGCQDFTVSKGYFVMDEDYRDRTDWIELKCKKCGKTTEFEIYR